MTTRKEIYEAAKDNARAWASSDDVVARVGTLAQEGVEVVLSRIEERPRYLVGYDVLVWSSGLHKTDPGAWLRFGAMVFAGLDSDADKMREKLRGSRRSFASFCRMIQERSTIYGDADRDAYSVMLDITCLPE